LEVEFFALHNKPKQLEEDELPGKLCAKQRMGEIESLERKSFVGLCKFQHL
jgi:hypothetical protein